MPEPESAAPRGTTRRDLLRRGGIVVGVAWAAPVLESMTSPAFADGSEAEGGLCDRLIYIKWSVDCADKKTYWANKEGYGNKSCYDNLLKNLPAAGLQPPVPKVQPASITKQKKSEAIIKDEGPITAFYEKAYDRVTITAPEDCRIVTYQAKLGGGNGCPFPAPLNAQPFPRSITVAGKGRGKGLSHVGLILCCND